MWYLGSPYTLYPRGTEAAFEEACRACSTLLRLGVETFSPIVHSHPLVPFCPDAHDNTFWERFNLPYIRVSSGLIVLMLEGWEKSKGLAHEIELFKADEKPIVYLPWGDR